jgi:hypothetical protein
MNFLPMTYGGNTYDVFFTTDEKLRVQQLEVKRDGQTVELEAGDVASFREGISAELVLTLMTYELMKKEGTLATA